MEVHAIRTWFDKNQGVVLVTDDVQNIVAQLKEISPRLHVFYNEQTEGFDVVESCLDGTDRLVTSVAELDGRLVERIRAADHWYGEDQPHRILPDDQDVAARVDAHNEEVEKAADEEFREKISDIGERLHWALDIGPGQHSPGGQVGGGPRKKTRFG